MWRVGSTAQPELTAKKNKKRERRYQRGMFNLSAFEAEPARRFWSGLTANPEFLPPKKHTCLFLIRGSRGPPKSTVSILRFSTGLEYDQICSRPRRSAMVTAWVRSLA